MINLPQKKIVNAKYEQGAVLLEALIAIVLFSMGILAIAGLQATMVKNTTDANYRAEANYIAQKEIGRLWADPKNINDYLTTGKPVDGLPNGVLKVERPNANEQVRITVTWRQPGEDEHKVVTNARMTGDVL